MENDPAERTQVIQASDGVYVRQAVDNMGWVDLGGEAVVVDALEQPHLEPEVFDAIAETLGDTPVRRVLNTHTHYDHVALNEAFERRCGAEIVNLSNTEIPEDGLCFEGRTRRVRMIPMAGLHTAEDCLVWAPEAKVLFVGDLFGWGLIPLTRALTDDSARNLAAAYDRMAAFEAETVVPGHGPVCSTAELRQWTAYFRRLIADVRDAVAAGRSDAQIMAETAPPEDMRRWWRFADWKHEDSLRKVLRAVRKDKLTGPPEG